MQKNDSPALDAFDLKILEHFQHDTRTPAEAIGAAVGLSTTAVQRRLKRMREAGVIAAEIAMLTPSLLDHPVTWAVAVTALAAALLGIDELVVLAAGAVIGLAAFYRPTGSALLVLPMWLQGDTAGDPPTLGRLGLLRSRAFQFLYDHHRHHHRLKRMRWTNFNILCDSFVSSCHRQLAFVFWTHQHALFESFIYSWDNFIALAGCNF